MTEPVPTLCMINYNGESYLERSLEALTRQTLPVAEVVLVDNASTDGSRHLVESGFPQVRIVAMSENLGAAAARNVALEEAGTDLVLLIDNDVILNPGALEKMVDALRGNPNAVTAMPAILYGGDETTIQYDGAEAHFLGHQSLDHEGVPYGSAPLEDRTLGSLVSACIIVDRSRLPGGHGDGLAPFDEDFFIYFEDHDFGYRMRAAGRDVLSVPSAFCYHGQGTPELSIRAIGSYSRRRVFFLIRNRWLFLVKNYSVRTLVILAPMLLAYELVQLGGVVKKGWLREWVRALGWVARRPGSLYRKRRETQRIRRVGDGVLLRNGPIPLRQEATATPLERGLRRLLDSVSGGYWRLVHRLV